MQSKQKQSADSTPENNLFFFSFFNNVFKNSPRPIRSQGPLSTSAHEFNMNSSLSSLHWFSTNACYHKHQTFSTVFFHFNTKHPVKVACDSSSISYWFTALSLRMMNTKKKESFSSWSWCFTSKNKQQFFAWSRFFKKKVAHFYFDVFSQTIRSPRLSVAL